MQENKKFYSFTWSQFDDCVDYITQAIKAQNLEFKGVGGLPRGGLPLAVALSHRLEIPYIDFNDKSAFKKINEQGSNYLLVDDISDSGTTFIDILAKTKGPVNIVTAALLRRRGSAYTPKFIGMEIIGEEWIVFPWEERIYFFE
jgi:uncharacterized protein